MVSGDNLDAGIPTLTVKLPDKILGRRTTSVFGIKAQYQTTSPDEIWRSVQTNNCDGPLPSKCILLLFLDIRRGIDDLFRSYNRR